MLTRVRRPRLPECARCRRTVRRAFLPRSCAQSSSGPSSRLPLGRHARGPLPRDRHRKGLPSRDGRRRLSRFAKSNRGRVAVAPSAAAGRPLPCRGCAPFPPLNLAVDCIAQECCSVFFLLKYRRNARQRAERQFRHNPFRPAQFSAHAWPHSNICPESHHFVCLFVDR